MDQSYGSIDSQDGNEVDKLESAKQSDILDDEDMAFIWSSFKKIASVSILVKIALVAFVFLVAVNGGGTFSIPGLSLNSKILAPSASSSPSDAASLNEVVRSSSVEPSRSVSLDSFDVEDMEVNDVDTVSARDIVNEEDTDDVYSDDAATDDAYSDCTVCPDVVTAPDCSNSSYPVMGGLDMVQYFSFENDSFVGVAGSSSYTYTYSGYTYYFINHANLKTFKEEPEKYAPQYGGFCSWGVAGEYCPKYFWSGSCLGPSGNWGIWTIHNERLYFFYLESAKDLFVADPDKYVTLGDARWSRWYSDTPVLYNTKCYFETPDLHASTMSMSLLAAESAESSSSSSSSGDGDAVTLV